MSRLERVTFSGPDDTVSPLELAMLSRQFPWIEWGVLVSAQQEGKDRYPSRAWRDHLARYVSDSRIRVSVHTQGRWLRALLQGDSAALREGVGPLLEVAGRVQFNFHGGPVAVDAEGFTRELLKPPLAGKQFIFQHDGCEGAQVMQLVWETVTNWENVDAVAFYDTSHGAGTLPSEWPPAEYETGSGHALHGYAGGLGPDNLEGELPRIAKAAGSGPYWIDCETKIRTTRVGGSVCDVFDLDKVRRMVGICAPVVGKDT